MKEALITYLPVVQAFTYAIFIFLTYISPETLWKTHGRDLPMDPVWSYAVKAKGSAIIGLLVGNLLATYTQALEHRLIPYVSCFAFQFFALINHGRAFLFEPEGYFVDSTLHFQYVVVHTLGCSIFGYLAFESKRAANEKAKKE